jgi:hypothetical protein
MFAVVLWTTLSVSAQSNLDEDEPAMPIPARSGRKADAGQLSTGRNANSVVVSSGQLFIELVDQYLNVEQQVRLVNLGQSTHLFSGFESFVRLPEGYRSFEAEVPQPSSDQRVTEVATKGFQLSGSLAPGAMVIAWRFQLSLAGSQTRFSVTLPWEIMTFRVFTQALPGISLRVDGMPEARPQTDQGVVALVTEFERKDSDAPFRTVTVQLAGIQGANPLRWVALILSIVIIVLGAIVAMRIKTVLYNNNKV